MRRKTRLVLLFTALAGAGAWAAFGAREPQERVSDTLAAAKNTPAAAAPAAPAAPEPASVMPERASFAQMGADPFNVEPPPAPAPVASAPPAPVRSAPPPLPYRFAGRLHVGSAVEVYLAKGDELISVKKGDKLDGQYRVEKIGRTEMTLLHLASGTREKIEYDPPIKEDDDALAETGAPETHAEAQRKARGG
jgi:hypothetical protein